MTRVARRAIDCPTTNCGTSSTASLTVWLAVIRQNGWRTLCLGSPKAARWKRCWTSPRRGRADDRTVAVDADNCAGDFGGVHERQPGHLRSDFGSAPVQLRTVAVHPW